MKKFTYVFAAILIIIILSIIIASRYIPFFDFDAKEWVIFGLVATISFLIGAYLNAISGFRGWGG